MERNQLISFLQVVCLFFGIWFTFALLFFNQEGSSDLVYHTETLNAIKGSGLSIIMVLSIIALQMFRKKTV